MSPAGEGSRLTHALRELRELGPSEVAYRARREIDFRTGVSRWTARTPLGNKAIELELDCAGRSAWSWIDRVQFGEPEAVCNRMKQRIGTTRLEHLSAVASDAARGRILCFGRWVGDYGSPIDWYVNPQNGEHWRPNVHWSQALRDEPRRGDVKLTWEVARFPQAYHLARAAVFEPSRMECSFAVLGSQVQSFLSNTRYPYGIHHVSAQEAVIRLCAWVFSLSTLARLGQRDERLERAVAARAVETVTVVRKEIAYSRQSVYNNHLLFEALSFLLVSRMLPDSSTVANWSEEATRELARQADRQFYEDGGYIQLSHNYHRVALQAMLWAWKLQTASVRELPARWKRAVERSIDFLVAHQNPVDGRLPNYGANDGAQPHILSTCDFSDFRPTLQAASIAVRGERLYPEGPWDEEAAWMLGAGALDAPLREPRRTTVSFGSTGFHVLRPGEPESFAAFRCGSIRDRFSQIDMLSMDLWWRGENVVVDPGSYLYNGAAIWHDHFATTAAHSTVAVDGRDQMLHYRRFKNLYWTAAKIVDQGEGERCAWITGEHYGYRRQDGAPTHRRSILAWRGELWVVLDRVTADAGRHAVRLHWLAGPYTHSFNAAKTLLTLETPRGTFAIQVLRPDGQRVTGDLLAGSTQPIRGWLSRYYGERTATPSMAVVERGARQIDLVTVLAPWPFSVERSSRGLQIVAASDCIIVGIDDGRLQLVEGRELQNRS